MEFLYKQIIDYGVAIIALAITAKFLAWLVKYILEKNARREDMLLGLMNNEIKSLTESTTRLSDSLNSFSSNVNEAHRFQREEHAKQLEKSDIVCGSLRQVELALGRINGYVHDK